KGHCVLRPEARDRRVADVVSACDVHQPASSRFGTSLLVFRELRRSPECEHSGASRDPARIAATSCAGRTIDWSGMWSTLPHWQPPRSYSLSPKQALHVCYVAYNACSYKTRRQITDPPEGLVCCCRHWASSWNCLTISNSQWHRRISNTWGAERIV